MFNREYHKIKPEIFENPLFSTQVKGMRLYGYIIGQDQRFQVWHLMRCIIFTTFSITCYLIFVKVWRGFDHLEDAATSWTTAFLYLSTAITTVNAYFQRRRVFTLINFIHDDMNFLLSCADRIETELFDNTVRYLRNITKALLAPSLLGGCIVYADCFFRTIFLPETVFNVPQIINGTAQPILLFKLLPLGEIYDNFFVGWLGPCYSVLLGITTIPIWHTFITCLMKYVTLKVEIINKRMRDMDVSKLNPNLRSLKDLTVSEQNFRRHKMCEFYVKEQIQIRWFVHELQQLMRIPVFCDFLIFTMLICFLFYALTTGSPSKMDYFFMFDYLFILGSILWLYHWHATLVSECNDKMIFAIYSCDWYNYPVPLQKSIRQMMMGASTPLVMRVIFVELNMKTFIDVVRASYSYFSILRNVNMN